MSPCGPVNNDIGTRCRKSIFNYMDSCGYINPTEVQH